MRPDDPPPLVWNAKADRSEQIDAYARTKGFVARWQWRPGVDDTARVLVEPEAEDLTRSAEWVAVPVGATVYRLEPGNRDSPLRVRMPAPAAAPFIE